MKEQNKNDNFAKEYWKSFEELAITLLEKKLENKDLYQFYIHKTPSQKDGGYDGIIFIEPKDNLSDDLKTLYTILMEAKLRKNDNKDLPLSDFAKTLIIAVNRSASEVYVFTNLHFSLETQRRVNQFSTATSLRVKLIDIFVICNEIKKFPELQSNFPIGFIQQLFDAEQIHNAEKKVIFKQRNMFENELPKLIGDYRNSLLIEYKEYFRKYTGVFIITGIQGCGKTLLLKHILYSLQYDFNCRFIQLEKFTTIKEFFIYFLSIIWNIETVEIYNLTEDNIDEITAYMPEELFPKRVKTILLSILKDFSSEYENRVDVFEEHLIEYLYFIFTPICKRKKQILAFTNFDKCTDNIMSFTNKLFRKFSSENIIFVAELRTDDPDSATYINEWTALNQNVKPAKLSEFDYLEFIQFMQENYSEAKNLDSLYEICYPVPIYIHNLMSFVYTNHLETLISNKELSIAKLYNNDKFKHNLILFSVSNYFRNKKADYRKLAYIIVFFDGEMSLVNLKKIGANYLEAISVLAESIYFELERNKLRIHHILYLKAFQNDTILSQYEYYEVLSELYESIDILDIDYNLIQIKKLQIAIELGEKKFIRKYWKKICSQLIIQNDFFLAKTILQKIFSQNLLCKQERLKVINYILKCYLGRNEYKSAELLSYIKLGGNFKEFSTISQWKIFCYQKAKYYFTIGEYKKALYLTNSYRNEDPQLRYIRALSIKHEYGIEHCLLSYKRGCKHFPEDWHLRYAFLDHLHSKYEKIDFEVAWNYLLQIEQYWDKMNLEDQIHFLYNKTALQLYRTQIPNMKACKELFCKTFENDLPIEMGRTHNLLGQIYYLNSSMDSAINEFEKSFSILNSHIHVTYIYVPLINLAIVYDTLDESVMCIQYIIKSLNYLEKYKKEKIKKQLINFNKIILEKECAAFIILMEIIQKRNTRIYQQYHIKFPEYNIETHSSSMFPKYYILGGKITFRC